jgi:uncharacterized membrane protein YczE
MTGLVARGAGSVRGVRTAIEVSVLLVGWLLSGTLWGGPVGPGTVLYALLVGPVLHRLLPLVQVMPPRAPRPRTDLAAD